MSTREPSRWLLILLAAGGGLLTNAAFPDRGWWPLAFLGVAAYFLAMRRDGAWWNALVGFVWGLAFFLPHIQWAQIATDTVPWLALSVLEAVFLALLGAMWTWVRRIGFVGRNLAWQVVTFSVLWVAIEQWRSEFPFGGFPWGRLAFSQVDSLLGRTAWLGGGLLVSLLTAAIGVLLAVFLLESRRLKVFPALCSLATAAVLLGVGLVVPLDVRAETGTLAIGAVQGNVDEPGLGSFANRGVVLQNHVDGTLALLDEVDPGELDVVLWPENGSDLDPQTTPDVAADIDEAASAVGAPILVGAQEFPESGGRYNVSLLWVPGEGVVDRYAKQHPAPFGEYIPMRSFVRIFSDQVDRVTTDMIAGDEVAVIDLPSERLGRTVRLGNVICFEVAYEELVRDAVNAGAELLVVPTNNASFGYSAESTQQLAMSRLRAIETGRATVQISTVGVSGIIAPNGALLQSTELFTPDQLIATLPLRDSLTPAVRAGYWPGWIAGGLSVLLVVAGITAHVRRAPTASTKGGKGGTRRPAAKKTARR
ncbi:apolipoprotein N-acyltransferase [Oerskovia merdavium]|uniref:Apolipoprotein N-acyltransferase n=1 Tax=Oerskovia merdavium TaxID=2762227 RepID=A0ABR8TYP3_9CELL|nr:apolipoprotein N-acyltransferase [Oerskovia merdavium]MBD7980565.1 apolipoprotein N-acyltransferase [Oerskovia merdavium]